MKVKINEVKKLMVDKLLTKKMNKDEALILAEEYLEGELQGKQSHGLMAFPSLVKKLPIKNKGAKIKKKTSSYLFIDANKNLGTIVGKQSAAKAIGMAKKQGVAIVLIKDMLSWLRPGAVAQFIAQNNMIGFVTNSGGRPMVAPPGGYTAAVGTNPIGIGIPTAKDNVVVDMATSKRAWGEVRKALADNSNLPPETYLDSRGNFTRNPKEAKSVIGAGDYKGFSLALFIEILAGSLIGMPMGKNILKGDYRTVSRGAMILVINPQFSNSLNEFKQANTKLIKDIKSSKKRKGTKVILMPGERGSQNKQKNLKKGYLEISNDLWKKLSSI